MIHRHLIRALALLMLSAAAAQSAEAPSQRWALLIGVNKYQHFDELRYCSNDIRALNDQLIASGFRQDHIFLICDDQTDDLSRLPFKANIERQLALFLTQPEENDLVLVAFSGHGMHIEGKSYLCPFEARDDAPDETMISLAEVQRKVEGSSAALRLMLVDACRNAPKRSVNKSAVDKRATAEFVKSLTRPPDGVMMLASCSAGQTSKEDEGFGHGVFMHYILEGLKGKADSDRNSKISLQELSKYASRETRTYVAQKFNDFQTPSLEGKLALEVLDYELVLVPATAPSTTVLSTNAPTMPLVATPIAPPPVISGPTSTSHPQTRTFPRLLDNYGPEEIVPPLQPVVRPAGSRSLITNSIGMPLVSIEPGTFQMGTDDGYGDEKPPHRVRITRPFYIGQTEVTRGQWESIMETKLSRFAREEPAINMTWEDAAEFCKKLSKKEGKSYRLPTEAEWEYSCRAGTSTMYSFGDDESILKQYALFKMNEADSHEVGLKRPNAWGLYDMHGNIREWCIDFYDSSYYEKSETNDPQGPSMGTTHVVRGGSFSSQPGGCMSTSRGAAKSERDDLGFRVVLEQ